MDPAKTGLAARVRSEVSPIRPDGSLSNEARARERSGSEKLH